MDDDGHQEEEDEPPDNMPDADEQDPDPHITPGADGTADNHESTEGPSATTTRSGCKVKVTQRAKESYEQRGRKWISWFSNLKEDSATPAKEDDDTYEIFAHMEYDVQD